MNDFVLYKMGDVIGIVDKYKCLLNISDARWKLFLQKIILVRKKLNITDNKRKIS